MSVLSRDGSGGGLFLLKGNRESLLQWRERVQSEPKVGIQGSVARKNLSSSAELSLQCSLPFPSTYFAHHRNQRAGTDNVIIGGPKETTGLSEYSSTNALHTHLGYTSTLVGPGVSREICNKDFAVTKAWAYAGSQPTRH